jgi:hypothetical protein
MWSASAASGSLFADGEGRQKITRGRRFWRALREPGRGRLKGFFDAKYPARKSMVIYRPGH